MHDRIVHSWYAALRRDDVTAITFRRFLRRRVSSHGVRHARTEGRSQHVSVEGTQGAHSAGGAPDTFLPPGASTGFCLGVSFETDGLINC